MNRQDMKDAKPYRFAGHSVDVFEEDKTGLDCSCFNEVPASACAAAMAKAY